MAYAGTSPGYRERGPLDPNTNRTESLPLVARPEQPSMPGSVTTDACVFCGDDSVEMSEEHLFADWVSNLFGRIPAGVAEVWDDSGVLQSWSSDVFQDVLKIVCRKCNNEWMSIMEGNVSALLGPMMKDGVISGLPPLFQEKLTKWAVKTAFVADYLLKLVTTSYPETEYGRFHSVKGPLPGHLVWYRVSKRLY